MWAEFLEEDFLEQLKNISISCDGFGWDLCNGTFNLDNPIITDIKGFIKKMGFEKWLILKGLENKTDDDKEEFAIDLCFIEIISVEHKTFVGNLKDSEIEEQINKKLQDILSGFLDTLRKEYNNLNSDEEIRNHLAINEYEFEVSGKRY